MELETLEKLSLKQGGWIGETTTGTKYAVFFDSVAGHLKIYKGVNNIPVSVAHVDEETIFGLAGEKSARGIAAAIDTKDKIHVLVASFDPETQLSEDPHTLDVAYRVFSTNDDTWDGHKWLQEGCDLRDVGHDVKAGVFVDSRDRPTFWAGADGQFSAIYFTEVAADREGPYYDH